MCEWCRFRCDVMCGVVCMSVWSVMCVCVCGVGSV